MKSRQGPAHPPRRRLMLGAGAALALANIGCGSPRTSPAGPWPRLRLIGDAVVPHRMPFDGTVIGGLSGLDYDESQDIWYALSDDRSDISPCRYYTLRLPIETSRIGAPRFTGVTTLLQPDGTPFPSRRAGGHAADPEALRLRPDKRTLLWTSEGDGRLGLDPFVRECDLQGRHLRQFELPAMFRMDKTQTRGPRDNLSFEGLALTPDAAQAWVAMEAPLVEDGHVPTASALGGPCRFTLFDLASGRAVRQIAYVPDAIPGPSVPPGTYADNGVSEVLMADARRMLVLERAYMSGVGNSLRLYLIDTTQASDTLATPVLDGNNHQPALKTLVADFAQTGLRRLDNTEGMAWGPKLNTGARSLVFVSDDNFNPAQVTQFVAFEWME